MIDLYCERLEPGLWAEPLNALSNLAFLVAAVALCAFYRRQQFSLFSAALVAALFAIAVGSTLFHTIATAWAQQADVIPILIFQLVFLAGYATEVVRLRWFGTVTLLVLFLLTGVGIGSLGLTMNGSDAYLAPLIFLTGLGIYHRVNTQTASWLLISAALIFVLSLTLRTMDAAACQWFPLGTHFIWHLLNALVLYLCGRSMVSGTANAS